jgi:hypothetical protein
MRDHSKLAVLFAVTSSCIFFVVDARADAGDLEARPGAPRTILRPGCAGQDCPPSHPRSARGQGHRLVYLNFDGATLTASTHVDDAATDTSSILSSAVPPGTSKVIAPFDPREMWNPDGLSREQIIARVVQEMYALHAAYDVDFVTERPTGADYHMVVFGGTCVGVSDESNCVGVANLDCGDAVPGNIVFVFPGDLRVGHLAVTAAQETAHALGLTHTWDWTDVMYPEIQSTFPDHFGAGNVPLSDPSCDGAAFQDSHRKMLDTLGPRRTDTIPPAVAITSPGHGSQVAPGVEVSATVTDDGEIAVVEFLVDDVVTATATVPPFSFPLPAEIPPGTVTLTVRAQDIVGNVGTDRITVHVTGSADPSCVGEPDCSSVTEPVEGCAMTGWRSRGAPASWLVALLALALAVRTAAPVRAATCGATTDRTPSPRCRSRERPARSR